MSKEMHFLGHLLTTEGIKIDPDKVEAIHRFHVSRNVKQLKGFLELINFCSKSKTHIPGTKNQIADALSRIPLNNRDEQTEEASIAVILTRKPNIELRNRLKNVASEQRGDEKIKDIITQLETGKECRDFHLKGNVLIKGKEGHERVVLTEG